MSLLKTTGLILFVFLSQQSYGQENVLKSPKPALDFQVFDNWKEVSGAIISDDGKFVAYTTRNLSFTKPTLIVKHTNGKILREFTNLQHSNIGGLYSEIGGINGFYANRYLIYEAINDSLIIYDLQNDRIKSILKVKNPKVANTGAKEVVVYLTTQNQENSQLAIYDYKADQYQFIDSVKNYSLAPDGKTVLYNTISPANRNLSVHCFDLTDRRQLFVADNALGIESFVWDERVHQAVFLRKADDHTILSIFNKQSGLVENLLSDDSLAEQLNIRIHSIVKFGGAGKSIVLKYQSRETAALTAKPDSSATNVTVWSYRDAVLATQQAVRPATGSPVYQAIFLIQSKQIVLIENTEQIASPVSKDWFLLSKRPISNLVHVEPFRKFFYSMQCVNDGQQFQLNWLDSSVYTRDEAGITISPNGRYFIYYDWRRSAYFCFDRSRGVTSRLVEYEKESINNKTALALSSRQTVEDLPAPYDPPNWLNDHELLINDEYDIWRVDASGKKKPVCVTGRSGQTDHIVFRLIPYLNGEFTNKTRKVWLSGFSPLTKKNGFFKADLSTSRAPEQISYENARYFCNTGKESLHREFIPVKAKSAQVCIVRKMSASVSPNYFTTTDFKNFEQVSDLYPERQYNWLTSELLTWTLSDGTKGQGILYKPENFDAAKKYPVIVHYYEELTNQLNAFEHPALANGGLNIPWFVSRGYIVFTPDIFYRRGHTAESVFRYINSGTDELVKLPFVDKNRIGLHGHSMGGYETLLMITQTNRFAAAIAGAPISSLVNMYNTLVGRDGRPLQISTEYAQPRMFSTPWESPGLYIQNSPVFNADKVTTPLLMMHNQNDGAVPVTEGIQFYLSLRRLGKICWLLQYDKESHTLNKKENAQDYTLRTTQFFDHYLKGAPFPLWMLDTGTAKEKGSKVNLALDTKGREPGRGLVSEEEQKKIDIYSRKTLGEKIKADNIP